MRVRQYLIFFIIFAGMLLGCSTTSKPIRDQAVDLGPFHNKLFLLEFDHNGKLANPLEVSRAASMLKQNKESIKKIIIMSYGWNGERSEALADYIKYINNYLNYVKEEAKIKEEARINSTNEMKYETHRAQQSIDIKKIDKELSIVQRSDSLVQSINQGSPNDPKNDLLKNAVIFCISWDSKSKGINRLFNDFLAAPLLADYLSFIPDYLLFPTSYWSKAGLADRIGSNDLRDTLEFILDEVHGTPVDFNSEKPIKLYLIGHSFGARILSSLAQTRLGKVDDPIPFKYNKYINGAAFILPAMIHLNVPRNSDSFASPENQQLKQPYPIVIAQSQHDHGNGFLYPLANIPLNSYSATGIENMLKKIHGNRRSNQGKLLQSSVDLVSIPLSIAWTGITLPLNYIYTQSFELYNRNANYLPDTLAQLPLVEIPVEAMDEILFSGEKEWGKRNKGLFNLGAINTSAATATAPVFGSFSTLPVYSKQDFLKYINNHYEFPDSVIYVDYSKTLRHSFYGGVDLGKKWWNYTIGWIDPIGSHTNFEEMEVHELIARILNDEIKIAPSALLTTKLPITH